MPALGHRNQPGLPRLSYRLGTHDAFLRRMLARLPGARIPDGPHRDARPLAPLKTRDPADLSLALLDAWATVADVLTFYQERIANEGFIETASERKSVLELARAIGYELNPGVSAAAWLAFTVEDAEGAPQRSRVPKGTRVMSIPGQDEVPQTFETAEEILARADWNAMRPLLRLPGVPRQGDRSLLLKGVSTLLRPGDAVLVVGAEQERDGTRERWDFRRVTRVEADPVADTTRIHWQEPLGWRRGARRVSPTRKEPRVYALRQRAGLFGHNAPPWETMPKEVRALVRDASGDPANVDDAEWPDFTISGVNARAALAEPADATATAAGSAATGTGMPVATPVATPVAPPAPPVPAPPQPTVPPGPGLGAPKPPGTAANPASGPVPPATTTSDVHLDAVYGGVVEGQWAVVSRPGYVEAYRVKAVVESAVAAFTISAKVTRLTLEGENQALFDAHLRGTVVFCQSEPLELAEEPLTAPIRERVVPLDRLVHGLQPGHVLLLTGKPSRALVRPGAVGKRPEAEDGLKTTTRLGLGDEVVLLEAPRPVPGPQPLQRWHVRDALGFEGWVEAPLAAFEPAPARDEDEETSEPATLAATAHDEGRTTLLLRAPLRRWYDPATVTVSGNVALATHGETVRETLGSGDGRREHQRFVLKRPHLTHEPASNARGGEPALKVLVNGVAWRRHDTLLGAGARDEAYLVRIDEEGNASVVMGDGRNGARLPTGEENVVAEYRHGVGLGGNVRPGVLKLLTARPYGVREVTNPLPASGGADPEAMADAKDNAPRTVLTLGRIVSLRDFEDFAASYAGIGKARADVLRFPGGTLVHVTVADAQGLPPEPHSLLLRGLRQAMDAARDPVVPVVVQAYAPRAFHVELRVKVDPRREAETVFKAVQAALADAFGFRRRAFGQPVSAAEVLSLVQAVPGVVAVDLDRLYAGRRPAEASPPPFLPARPARMDPGQLPHPADLLLLAPRGVAIVPMEEKP